MQKKVLISLVILSLIALFYFFSLKRFLTSLIILSSIVFFSTVGKYRSLLVLGEGTILCKVIGFLGLSMGIGIDQLIDLSIFLEKFL